MKKTLVVILIFTIILFAILLAFKTFKKPVPTNISTDQNPPDFVIKDDEKIERNDERFKNWINDANE